MSIILVGGGPDTVTTPVIFDRFVKDVRNRAGGSKPPRIAVVLFDREGSSEYFLPAYLEPLQSRTPGQLTPILLRSNEPVDPETFDDVDGIVVGGGPTPDYLAGLQGSAAAIRTAVAAGVPYLGFSAGAMIAPQRALVGGYRIRGIEVCSEECSEGLDELDVRDGLGLVPFAVDVHTAQAGTLSRAVAAVAEGLMDRAVAVDENTALVLRHADLEDLEVIGTGNCWTIRGSGRKATVAMLSAG
ncbi:Type 1 glutamine amidotransferase-like domain-containing protein [Arthrobacter sp. C9C5]|uniref:Type 1 glutamine amidotransferase-like domain-containing protein n=1 Tax=Arthrobacter sp. C9C5 TaxID=2735267 RepID=UPI0015858FA7|nr:Type 1 glutamine amidotransferase-like domain-containing protein [Arthrobacter sp. C9C5]NUU30536.1 type 1 glutamine amidotransferase-like domain-containing protein [Arthrobacter sp. C9C5]